MATLFGLLALLGALLPQAYNPLLALLPNPDLWQTPAAQRLARLSRGLGRAFLLCLALALLAHGLAPRLDAATALYLQLGGLCAAWLLSAILLLIALALQRRN